MVRMWQRRSALIASIMAARVVVLPDPVGPHTRTRPLGLSASSWQTLGSPSSSNEGMTSLTCRSTMAAAPRDRYALTRNRPMPGSVRAQSHSWSATKAARSSSDGRAPSTMRSVSSRRQLGQVEGPQVAGHPDEGRRAGPDVHVRGPVGDGRVQDVAQRGGRPRRGGGSTCSAGRGGQGHDPQFRPIRGFSAPSTRPNWTAFRADNPSRAASAGHGTGMGRRLHGGQVGPELVGLDIGASGIRAVQLKRDRKTGDVRDRARPRPSTCPAARCATAPSPTEKAVARR